MTFLTPLLVTNDDTYLVLVIGPVAEFHIRESFTFRLLDMHNESGVS